MKALVLGMSVLALALAGPAAAVQDNVRDAGEKRTEQVRNDGLVGERCVSRHFQQWDAEAFCAEKLSCAADAVKCKGGSSRWVCTCTADG